MLASIFGSYKIDWSPLPGTFSFFTWEPVSDGKMIAGIAVEKSKTCVMGTRLQHFTEDPIKTARFPVVAPQNYFYKVMGT